MNARIGLFLCYLVGGAFGYNVQREFGYNNIPNDLYSVGVGQNFVPEQSQRLFWGNQGSNQVGGTGFWAMLTNKFPFLGTMFGRMELPTQYGAPNQYDVSTQNGAPGRFQTQYGTPNQYDVSTQNGAPGRFQTQYFRTQQFAPAGRDVALTDDAVIITPPQVPIVPGPVPVPAPIPAQEPAAGYQYDKPQYRLQLPRS